MTLLNEDRQLDSNNSKVDVSILICTRNRCADLQKTLASLAETVVPADLVIEVLVVDNGSTDQTASFISQARFKGRPVRCVYERERGLDFARNAGVRSSNGQVILLTDDDVRIPLNWIDPMVRPILNNIADAVAGGIEMAEHLHRPWMRGDVLVWRRVVSDPPEGEKPALIGANCAFSRKIFATISGFDNELDAGQLGLAGDILLSNQVQEAGFRVVSAISKTAVIHHFDPSRLTRRSLVQRSRDQGRSDAYISYHWCHDDPAYVVLRLAYRLIRLLILRGTYVFGKPPAEGLSSSESDAIIRVENYRGLLVERRRLRQYSKRGLQKLTVTNSKSLPAVENVQVASS